MTSAVFILPAAYREAGNALAMSMGYGPDTYSVPLSATGEAPATHYGCRADVGADFIAMLADPPEDAMLVLAVLVLDLADTAQAFAHWSSVLTVNGLAVVLDDA